MEVSRSVLLELALREIDFDISDFEESFSKRKTLQKLIYLLQASGVDLLYSFR